MTLVETATQRIEVRRVHHRDVFHGECLQCNRTVIAEVIGMVHGWLGDHQCPGQ